MKRQHARALGPILRRRRIELKITQPAIARALGYASSQFVSQWENGKCAIPAAKLPAIAEMLSLNLTSLVNNGIDSYAKEFKIEVKKCRLTMKEKKAIQRLRLAALKAKIQADTTGRRQRQS